MSKLFSDSTDKNVRTKHCKKCNRTLSENHFGKASGANYLYYECKKCTSKLNKIRKKLKKENPLIDPENYKCPICKRTSKETGASGGQRLKYPWVIDHDHITEKYRGYICHSCNRGLGLFQDSTKILLNAIEYLQKKHIKKNKKMFLEKHFD